MSEIDGTWDCVTKSPLGEQKSVLTLASEGTTVTGSSVSQTGTIEVLDGAFTGGTFTWKMKITTPFPMTLDGTVTISGNTLEGGIKAGAFGTHPIKGTKRA